MNKTKIVKIQRSRSPGRASFAKVADFFSFIIIFSLKHRPIRETNQKTISWLFCQRHTRKKVPKSILTILYHFARRL